MLSPFRQPSGIRASEDRGGAPLRPKGPKVPFLSRAPGALLPTALLLWTLSGCIYGFRAGAGFPPYIKTVAIVPFENDTDRPELTDEIFQQLLREFPRSQGLQPAGEDVADAVVRGTIQRYDYSAPSYRSGGGVQNVQVLQRQVTVVVEVQIINLVDNQILWEGRSVSGQGQYLESESEDVGRVLAIEQIVQRIIDGAQSNW